MAKNIPQIALPNPELKLPDSVPFCDENRKIMYSMISSGIGANILFIRLLFITGSVSP